VRSICGYRADVGFVYKAFGDDGETGADSIGYSECLTDFALLTAVVICFEKFNLLSTWTSRYLIEWDHLISMFLSLGRREVAVDL